MESSLKQSRLVRDMRALFGGMECDKLKKQQCNYSLQQNLFTESLTGGCQKVESSLKPSRLLRIHWMFCGKILDMGQVFRF